MARGLLEDLGIDERIILKWIVKGMGWIHPQSRDNWWVIVNTAINSWVPKMWIFFSIS
jgi:hypothetical protein